MATKFSDFTPIDTTTTNSFYIVGYSADDDNPQGENVVTQQAINLNDYITTAKHNEKHNNLNLMSYYGVEDSKGNITASAGTAQVYNPSASTTFNNAATTGYVDFAVRNKTSGATFSIEKYISLNDYTQSSSYIVSYDPLSTSNTDLGGLATPGYVGYAINNKVSAAKISVTEYYASDANNTQTASKSISYSPTGSKVDLGNYCTTGYVDYRFKQIKTLPNTSRTGQVLINNSTDNVVWNNYGSIIISGSTGSAAKKFYDTFTARNVSNDFLSNITYYNSPVNYSYISYESPGVKDKGLTGEVTINTAYSIVDGYETNIPITSEMKLGLVHINDTICSTITTINDEKKTITNGLLNIIVDIGGQNKNGAGQKTYNYLLEIESYKHNDSYKGLAISIQVPLHTKTLTLYRPYTISVNHDPSLTLGCDYAPTMLQFYLPPDTTSTRYRLIHHNHLMRINSFNTMNYSNSPYLFRRTYVWKTKPQQTPTNANEFCILGKCLDGTPDIANFSFMFIGSADDGKTNPKTITIDVLHLNSFDDINPLNGWTRYPYWVT